MPVFRHRRLRAGAVGLVAVALLSGTSACADDAPSTPSESGAPERSASTAVVSRKDVTGDGAADVTSYRVLRGDRVRITVRTGDGSPTSRVLDTSMWPGPGGAWLGSAPVDGEAGAELVVGTAQGAHTPLSTVLTMRAGRLRILPNPAGQTPQWWTDAFAGGFAGWTRRVRGDEVRMTFTVVLRVGDTHRWRGTRDTYVWDDGWRSAGSRRLVIRGDQAASEVSGWRVRGLPRGYGG
jgi:hypothetical protein